MHSFYAGMGGFVIDLKSLDVGILETGCLGDLSQLVIMPYGVELLIRCGYLPDMGKNEIEDKNRSTSSPKQFAALKSVDSYSRVSSGSVSNFRSHSSRCTHWLTSLAL